MRVQSSSCGFPRASLSFVRPRASLSFDQWHVTRSPKGNAFELGGITIPFEHRERIVSAFEDVNEGYLIVAGTLQTMSSPRWPSLAYSVERGAKET